MNLRRLEDGIWLESSGTLLPWNAKLDALQKAGAPEVHEVSDRTILRWPNQLWLDGLSCEISAVYYHQSTDPVASVNREHGLRMVNFSIYKEVDGNMREAYSASKDALLSRLGDPSLDLEGFRFGLPLSEWDLEHVLISLFVFERFGEFLVGQVWRKPLPQWRANH